MALDQKTLIRAVVRQVHPDLFTAYPFERSRNAESLKVGLHLAADVTPPQPTSLFADVMLF